MKSETAPVVGVNRLAENSSSGISPSKSKSERHRLLSSTAARQVRAARLLQMELELSPSQRRRYQQVPERYRYEWLKAALGKASQQKAINAKCNDCCGWEDLKETVGDCTAVCCPLWQFRPHQDRSSKEHGKTP